MGKVASDLAVKEKVNREVLGALAKQKQSNSMAYMGNKPAVRSALAAVARSPSELASRFVSRSGIGLQLIASLTGNARTVRLHSH